jgi:glucose/arabinose dehydrogenase
VTTLPGELLQGGSAQVLEVDPETGDSQVVADGLVAATGLAVAPTGDIFVAELSPTGSRGSRRGPRRPSRGPTR